MKYRGLKVICKDCKQDKPSEQFYSRDTACKECRLIQRRKYYKENKEKIRVKQLEYYEKNREWLDENRRQYARKRNYGLDEEAYQRLVEHQGGLCAVCNRTNTGKKQSLDVDHDHATGKVRGLLCNRCNQAVGLLNDDPNLFERVAEYLRSNS